LKFDPAAAGNYSLIGQLQAEPNFNAKVGSFT
jgi:hypothetical protein